MKEFQSKRTPNSSQETLIEFSNFDDPSTMLKKQDSFLSMKQDYNYVQENSNVVYHVHKIKENYFEAIKDVSMVDDSIFAKEIALISNLTNAPTENHTRTESVKDEVDDDIIEEIIIEEEIADEIPDKNPKKVSSTNKIEEDEKIEEKTTRKVEKEDAPTIEIQIPDTAEEISIQEYKTENPKPILPEKSSNATPSRSRKTSITSHSSHSSINSRSNLKKHVFPVTIASTLDKTSLNSSSKYSSVNSTINTPDTTKKTAEDGTNLRIERILGILRDVEIDNKSMVPHQKVKQYESYQRYKKLRN